MNLSKLKDILKSEPDFRIRQIEKAIYKDFCENWNEVTTLPLKLRGILNKEIDLSINGKILKSEGSDSLKALIKLDDEITVETVLLMHKDGRRTVCVSSQAGCASGCIFCKTGKLGFKRNLRVEEIILQALFFSRYLKKQNMRITNVVFMGMGEPLLNYDNVLDSIKILNDKNKFDISQRKISVSTCGIIEKIKLLAEKKLQINLAISINAPNDNIRQKIMPIAYKYQLNELLSAANYYIKKTNRRIMFEYVLLKEINDKSEYAQELAKKIKGLLCFVNLIPYNGEDQDKKPSLKSINEFKKILLINQIPVTQRYRFGTDIKAACGQLVFLKEKNNYLS
jgi:23S rRNA (adenine2503-C2)-methyltransferase